VIILFFLLYIAADAAIQAYLIERRRVWINHSWSACIAVVATVVAQCYADCLIAPLLLSLRWTAFDLLLNIFRGKAWNYTGTVTPKSSLLDKLFHYFPLQFTLKLTLLITSIIIIYENSKK
jgi:hypothetical protein